MKKTVLNDFFVYEYPLIRFYKKPKTVEPVLEIKNTNNNAPYQDSYNKRHIGRHYYGKKRRYYSDYI
jgi:hypothetical protein